VENTQSELPPLETRKEYALRHYALFHAPIEILDKMLYVRTVCKMGGAYLVRAGDEERAVLSRHCGAVGDTNYVTLKPMCIEHGGYGVYYASTGWMDVGVPSRRKRRGSWPSVRRRSTDTRTSSRQQPRLRSWTRVTGRRPSAAQPTVPPPAGRCRLERRSSARL
jgi:hypothetical protein